VSSLEIGNRSTAQVNGVGENPLNGSGGIPVRKSGK